MAVFSISLAVEVDAASLEEAYDIQESMTELLLNRVDVLSVTEIDVEELDG